MLLETLYKRTKTGAIQLWNIEVVDSNIVKQAGQLNGKLTIHLEEIKVGKNIGRSNETTPVQQAELQAQSDWTRKHDEGYKSLADLDITEGTVGTLVGQYMMYKTHGIYSYNLEYCLNASLPKFNSDANGNVKPMLAKEVNWDKVIYPCIVQPKLDGVRCLMIFKLDIDQPGAVFSVTMLSRSGKEYTTLNHIIVDVERSRLNGNLNESFILDGEIYSDELSFQEIVAAVKKERLDSLKLKFRAYDMINTEAQRPRLRSTIELVHKINSDFIQLVLHTTCGSEEEVQAYHAEYVSKGYEGAMIRLFNGTYDQGQRSSSLMKVKEFMTHEYNFITFTTGLRNQDLIACCSLGDQEFRAKMEGTVAEKELLHSQNAILSGKPITICHFGYTDGGLPRFPIGISFRDYE